LEMLYNRHEPIKVALRNASIRNALRDASIIDASIRDALSRCNNCPDERQKFYLARQDCVV